MQSCRVDGFGKVNSLCFQSLSDMPSANSNYESQQLLDEYLLFHYGTAEEILPYPFGPHAALNFPSRCVAELVDTTALSANARGLEIGCAVGRASFELARSCASVVGIDYSKTFIQAATTLAADGQLAYRRLESGNTYTDCIAHVEPAVDRSRVCFEQGDAQNLRDDLGQFEVVLACNLICRLAEPTRLLKRLPDLVKPGGQLVITTPFTWLETYTPAAHWLGTHHAGDSFAGLRGGLEGCFDLLEVKDMPFLIREHVRKFQWSVAQASIWRRQH